MGLYRVLRGHMGFWVEQIKILKLLGLGSKGLRLCA